MDAKVDGWVVTPRRGKAVEINALWYNALRLLEGWLVDAARRRRRGATIRARADRVYESFNKRFWMRRARLSVRRRRRRGRRQPRSAARTRFSRSRSTTRCSTARAGSRCCASCSERLLTPVGLRSLAPGEPDYKSRYFGDLRSRDAAYHQGTVWAWLIGPWVDAWLKVHPDDRAGARAFLDGLHRGARRIRHRHDRRDLRRRTSVHAPRLHRAGLERGGGAAVLGEDGARWRPSDSAADANREADDDRAGCRAGPSRCRACRRAVRA